jgi:NAD(P)-dependent dehydrogenase (short-subunit alcohol dehydrogenase family)
MVGPVMPDQKVALITGCSNPESLGAALALDLLQKGYRVYATSINKTDMIQLEKSGCDVGITPE